MAMAQYTQYISSVLIIFFLWTEKALGSDLLVSAGNSVESALLVNLTTSIVAPGLSEEGKPTYKAETLAGIVSQRDLNQNLQSLYSPEELNKLDDQSIQKVFRTLVGTEMLDLIFTRELIHNKGKEAIWDNLEIVQQIVIDELGEQAAPGIRISFRNNAEYFLAQWYFKLILTSWFDKRKNLQSPQEHKNLQTHIDDVWLNILTEDEQINSVCKGGNFFTNFKNTMMEKFSPYDPKITFDANSQDQKVVHSKLCSFVSTSEPAQLNIDRINYKSTLANTWLVSQRIWQTAQKKYLFFRRGPPEFSSHPMQQYEQVAAQKEECLVLCKNSKNSKNCVDQCNSRHTADLNKLNLGSLEKVKREYANFKSDLNRQIGANAITLELTQFKGESSAIQQEISQLKRNNLLRYVGGDCDSNTKSAFTRLAKNQMKCLEIKKALANKDISYNVQQYSVDLPTLGYLFNENVIPQVADWLKKAKSSAEIVLVDRVLAPIEPIGPIEYAPLKPPIIFLRLLKSSLSKFIPWPDSQIRDFASYILQIVKPNFISQILASACIAQKSPINDQTVDPQFLIPIVHCETLNKHYQFQSSSGQRRTILLPKIDADPLDFFK